MSSQNSIKQLICNFSFRFVEHPLFLKFCNALRPGYYPASRKVLSENIIPKLYDAELNNGKKILKNQFVNFSLDGWDNVRHEPIICTAITLDNGETYLGKTIDTSGISHSSENLEKMGIFLIQKLNDIFTINFYISCST